MSLLLLFNTAEAVDPEPTPVVADFRPRLGLSLKLGAFAAAVALSEPLAAALMQSAATPGA